MREGGEDPSSLTETHMPHCEIHTLLVLHVFVSMEELRLIVSSGVLTVDVILYLLNHQIHNRWKRLCRRSQGVRLLLVSCAYMHIYSICTIFKGTVICGYLLYPNFNNSLKIGTYYRNVRKCQILKDILQIH